MWVVIISMGSRGDCEPYIHLAAGLEKKGHRVTLAVEEIHRPLVRDLLGSGSSVEFLGMNGDIEALQRTERWQELMARRDMYSLMLAILFYVEENYLANARSLLAAMRKEKGVKPDAIVANLTVWLTALPVAEGLKVPLIIAPFLPPSYASSEYAPPLIRPRPFPLGVLNLVAGWVGEEVFIATHQPLLPKLRIMQAEAGCGAVNLRQCLSRMVLMPFATAYPTLLFRRPRTWDAINITCCGALTDPAAWDPKVSKALDGQAHAKKAAAVQAFLDAHPQDRPVFISWGSILGMRSDLTRLAIGALCQSRRRGILQRGWAGISASQLDPTDPGDALLLEYAAENIYELEGSLPHAWLFPKCSVIVHHGGSGTTAAATYAGVPQVVVPVIADQPFWAGRVAEAGIGFPRPISAYDITIKDLAEMIFHVSTDPEVRRAAEAARTEVQQEDGVGNMIAVIEREAKRGGEALWQSVYERVGWEEKWRLYRAGLMVGVAGVVTAALGAGVLIAARRLARSR